MSDSQVQHFMLHFTLDDLKILDEVLSNSGPVKVIVPLINKINSQVKSQTTPPTEQRSTPEPTPIRVVEPEPTVYVREG